MHDFVVVGAGISGLFTSYLLSKKGYKTLLVEKNNYLGGRSAKRKAKDWGWINKEKILPYGPHIIPMGGEMEKLLKILNIKSKKLKMPIFVFNQEKEIWDFNKPLSLAMFFLKTSKISLNEKISLIKIIFNICNSKEDYLIKEYGNLSVFNFFKKFNIKSEKLLNLFRIITGSYCFNDNIHTCPALDLISNIKLAVKSLFRNQTIMFQADYNELFSSLSKNIGEKNIVFNKKVVGLKNQNNHMKSVILDDDTELSTKNVIFTGHPNELKAILKKSGIKTDFIKDYDSLKPATLIDIMIKPNKNLFEFKTDWLTICGDASGCMIIKEDDIFHCCVISYNKKNSKKELIGIIKNDIKKILNYDVDKDSEWIIIAELIGHNVERNVILPFYKRMGPKTPIKGLYCVGESYKTLYTGTEGCLYSVNDFMNNLKKN